MDHPTYHDLSRLGYNNFVVVMRGLKGVSIPLFGRFLKLSYSYGRVILVITLLFSPGPHLALSPVDPPINGHSAVQKFHCEVA